MDLDLGSKEVLRVKFSGETYDVSLPNVKQAKKFQSMMKKNEGEELEVFTEFLDDLGLPKDISETLTINQLKLLSDNLVGDVKKK